jgi:hypothetical protein
MVIPNCLGVLPVSAFIACTRAFRAASARCSDNSWFLSPAPLKLLRVSVCPTTLTVIGPEAAALTTELAALDTLLGTVPALFGVQELKLAITVGAGAGAGAGTGAGAGAGAGAGISAMVLNGMLAPEMPVSQDDSNATPSSATDILKNFIRSTVWDERRRARLNDSKYSALPR